MELQAKLDAKTAELDTAARREQAFREALEKAKKNLTDADAARAVLEDDLAKVRVLDIIEDFFYLEDCYFYQPMTIIVGRRERAFLPSDCKEQRGTCCCR